MPNPSPFPRPREPDRPSGALRAGEFQNIFLPRDFFGDADPREKRVQIVGKCGAAAALILLFYAILAGVFGNFSTHERAMGQCRRKPGSRTHWGRDALSKENVP
jgi:hypothetical protein